VIKKDSSVEDAISIDSVSKRRLKRKVSAQQPQEPVSEKKEEDSKENLYKMVQ